jgi:hypothetical protein
MRRPVRAASGDDHADKRGVQWGVGTFSLLNCASQFADVDGKIRATHGYGASSGRGALLVGIGTDLPAASQRPPERLPLLNIVR